MTKSIGCAALLALAGCSQGAHVAPVALPPLSVNARALRFAKLVDGNGTITTDATIIVDGDHIVSVGSGDGAVPKGVTVVDLRHYTAIPGLIDVHTHMTYWWDHAPGTRPFGGGGTRRMPAEVATVAMENARLTLESGVTTVRDLGASGYADLLMRDRINRGEAVGPRMFVAGFGLSKATPRQNAAPPASALPASGAPAQPSNARGAVAPPASPAWLRGRITSLADIPLAVKTQADSGADVIKMYGSTGTGADTSGVQTFTYDEMKAAVDAAHALGKRIAIHSYPTAAATRCARGRTRWSTPSISTMRRSRRWCGKARFMSRPSITTGTTPTFAPTTATATIRRAGSTPFARATSRRRVGRSRPAQARDGVGRGAMMFGQNTRELGQLVQAGMSSLDALRAATVTGAEVLGMTDKIGRVAPGYYADIVAVEGDPARDVNATIYGVRWVMKGGAVVVDKRTAR
jgi:imidazolonepropionase-like amidohydrolase